MSVILFAMAVFLGGLLTGLTIGSSNDEASDLKRRVTKLERDATSAYWQNRYLEAHAQQARRK